MHAIRAVSIDLDDTLWAVAPVIIEAERRLHNWLAARCPCVTQRYSIEALRDVRRQVQREHPHLGHDLTALRKLTLERVLMECGCDPAWAEPAFEEFIIARNRVSLYPEVVPTLERLSKRFPLVSLSNGNADLSRIGLGRFFVACISARDVGAAKPHPKVFLAGCESVGHLPEHVIHVGDHPDQDIIGAAEVGMKTIWVNRRQQVWNHDYRPDAEVQSLSEVPELLC